MSKTFFSLFANDGEKAGNTKYKKYVGKDADGKAKFDEVIADYRITNTESSVSGSAIKDRSQAGHPVIRVNFGVKDGESTAYFNGTLNLSKQKKSENAPDMFGTASKKDGSEMDLACWFKTDKNGSKYLSCSMQEPYTKDEASAPASAPAAADMDDDIPF